MKQHICMYVIKSSVCEMPDKLAQRHNYTIAQRNPGVCNYGDQIRHSMLIAMWREPSVYNVHLACRGFVLWVFSFMHSIQKSTLT